MDLVQTHPNIGGATITSHLRPVVVQSSRCNNNQYSTATYNNASGIVTVTTVRTTRRGGWRYPQVANITWSCSLGNKVYPKWYPKTQLLQAQLIQAAKDSAAAKFDVITNLINNYNYNVPD